MTKYGTPSGRLEHCQRCGLALDVDEVGRVPRHRLRVGSSWINGAHSDRIDMRFCDKSGHPSTEELARRKDRRKLARAEAAEKARDDIAVAIDAVAEGRADYDKHIPEWRRAALEHHNRVHNSKHTHPYEYATSCAVQSRRAHTLGDVYCRFCGERLFHQVKDPHKRVSESHEARKHLTICALQILAGMREPAKPGYRALPLEMQWREDEPLFGDRP